MWSADVSDTWEHAYDIALKVQLGGTDIVRRIPWQQTAVPKEIILEALHQAVCDRFILQKPVDLSYVDDSGILRPIVSIDIWRTLIKNTELNQLGRKIIKIQVNTQTRSTDKQ